MNSIAAIRPQDVQTRLHNGEALTIIDVREDDEVANGMIQGAKHIPLAELPERHSEIQDNGEIIVVCRSGGRSAKACEYLRSVGYKGLTNLTGGMLEWDNL